ncbi:hypothetical protein D6851_15225 [Altericroceibacterium spongiae]|uniref:Lipocalin-like domain-containing protein n=2 Tax=Altericroceibacterium spongiae TaxID=2320269 RepID=A0A420EC09_9SPHN|nr:hypothetical protein D6851_15225 [Altericroceibacterium spongiae]
MLGRWGLVAADCTSTNGDAKGLMIVKPKALEFYESVGTLARMSESDAGKIRANFSFSGEGMSWDREQQLTLTDNGQTLIRREYGEDAAPDTFQYKKCGA